MKFILRIALFVFAGTARAQQIPTFSTTVNLVSVLANVHDHDGRIVAGLNQSDFVLREDGKPQVIHYFSREANLPLTIGLLVDTSRSQAGVLQQEGRASYVFLDRVLRPGDRAFVVNFDSHVDTLQGLTSTRSDLVAALQKLQVPDQVATLLYSAVQRSADSVLRAQQGRKAVILLTDGVAYKDPSSIDNAIEAAQRADTIIYSIRFSDPPRTYRPLRSAFMATMRERGKADLERMAKETGGVAYEVSSQHPIEEIYAEIEADLRSQYEIGYTPGRPAPDGKYHHIRLTTLDRTLIVDARAGYYAK